MEKEKTLQEMMQDFEIKSKLCEIVKGYLCDNERSIEWTNKTINEALQRIENGVDVASWEKDSVESLRTEIKARILFTEKLIKAFS